MRNVRKINCTKWNWNKTFTAKISIINREEKKKILLYFSQNEWMWMMIANHHWWWSLFNNDICWFGKYFCYDSFHFKWIRNYLYTFFYLFSFFFFLILWCRNDTDFISLAKCTLSHNLYAVIFYIWQCTQSVGICEVVWWI